MQLTLRMTRTERLTLQRVRCVKFAISAAHVMNTSNQALAYLLVVYLRYKITNFGGCEVQLQAFPELHIVEQVTKALQRGCVITLQKNSFVGTA